MKAAFCPICDQKLKKRHYCSNCKSFVMKPVMMEDYTNRYSEETINNKAVFKREKPATKTVTFPAGHNKIRTILGIALILVGIFMSFIRSLEEGQPDNYNEDYYNGEYTEEEITLLKDTVIKDYDECNGLKHMDIKADEFIPVLDAYMEGKMPITSIDEDDYLKLVRRIYEDGETEEKTYFHSYIDTYYLEDIYLGYYIDYDTVSHRIHVFDAESENKEFLMEIIQLFMDATSEELLSADESLEDFFAYDKDDYMSLYRGDYWLYFSTYEYEEELYYYFSAELD